MTALLIVGAGGHGKVVADTASAMARWQEFAFLDDARCSDVFDRWPVLGRIDSIASHRDQYSDVVVALGDNWLRLLRLQEFRELGFALPPVIHPTASVSDTAILGDGTVVFAQAVVGCDSTIGLGGIVNTGATVDHDCHLGDGVHISPGAHLAGGVRVAARAWVGIGASVIQSIRIGENATVGAGAVVIADVMPNNTVVGNPAKVVKGHC